MQSVNRTHSRFHPAHAALATIALLAAPLAQAHHPMGGMLPTTFTEGLLSGIGHPVIGLDHFAFLIVVALLSATLRGAPRLLVPLAFVSATLAGTLYHLSAADLPLTETVIALSVLLGGLVIVLRRSLPALLLGSLVGAIGVFHGYAYGESIIGAEQTPLLAYLLGFALVQYAIIAGGVKLMQGIARRSARWQAITARTGGLAAMTTGAVFLGLSLV